MQNGRGHFSRKMNVPQSASGGGQAISNRVTASGSTGRRLWLRRVSSKVAGMESSTRQWLSSGQATDSTVVRKSQ